MAPFHTISNYPIPSQTIQDNHIPCMHSTPFSTIPYHPEPPSPFCTSRIIAHCHASSRTIVCYLKKIQHRSPTSFTTQRHSAQFSSILHDPPLSHTIPQYHAKFRTSRIILHHFESTYTKSHHRSLFCTIRTIPQRPAPISTILHYFTSFCTTPHQSEPPCIIELHPVSSFDIPHYPAKETKSRIIRELVRMLTVWELTVWKLSPQSTIQKLCFMVYSKTNPSTSHQLSHSSYRPTDVPNT